VPSTNEPSPGDTFPRHGLFLAVAVVVVASFPIGFWRGAPAVALWVAFALLAAAVLIFWEALRTVLDPAAPGDPLDTDDAGTPSALEARKRAALKALKDIAFERSIGRLSEEDYQELEARYRAEARDAMRAIDEGLGPWLARAEAMLAETAQNALNLEGEGPPADLPPREATLSHDKQCVKCATVNDGDAVFCKKCGARITPEAHDAG